MARIAVIGAGAAGVATAWLLDPAHVVTVYEAAPTCGGHVRTLGGNVAGPDLDGLRVDTGVIELERRNFPTVLRLMEALGVGIRPVPGTTTLIRPDGPRLYSPGAVGDAGLAMMEAVRAHARNVALADAHAAFDAAVLARQPGQRLGEFLPDGPGGRWVALLALYAWSTPLAGVPDLSADLAGPTLSAFAHPEGWYAIEGGTFAWIARALATVRARVWTSTAPRAVRRDEGGVTVVLPDGSEVRYDAVVLAVPPHRLLDLIVDADEHERRWYGGFRGRTMTTVVHDDPGPYARRGETYRSEFDCFDLGDGRGAYNARLDRLCGARPPWEGLGLAWGLDDELDPARVRWRQEHEVSDYTATALAHRSAVVGCQGHRRTWIAGAWLGDGLHEGAIASAVAVAERLGGRPL